MIRCAILDPITRIVANVILLNDEDQVTDPINMKLTEQASIGDIYDDVNNSFTAQVVVRDLETERQNKLTELGNMLNEREFAGVWYNNNRYATDRDSQIKYLGILMSATMDPTYTINFKTLDSSYVNLAAQDILNLTTAVKSYITECYNNDDDLTKQIKTANDLTTIDAIDVTKGWPPSANDPPPPVSIVK